MHRRLPYVVAFAASALLAACVGGCGGGDSTDSTAAGGAGGTEDAGSDTAVGDVGTDGSGGSKDASSDAKDGSVDGAGGAAGDASDGSAEGSDASEDASQDGTSDDGADGPVDDGSDGALDDGADGSGDDASDDGCSMQPEICDGIDNNCDGAIDEGFGSTTCGLGACKVTTQDCLNGVPQTCTPGDPQPETCNGIDDNCDGTIDEGCQCLDGTTQSCYSGAPGTVAVGVCKAGTQTCANGQWGSCQGEVVPASETCNGEDDDCDGTADNGDPDGGKTCDTGKLGVCAAGKTACTNGAIVCNQVAQPSAESCNGLDDDCDGTIDNGDPGAGAACNTGKQGVCSAGTTACTNGALVCNESVQPSAEICNGLDDDCDGTPDNGDPGGGAACNTGKQGVCSAGTTACTNGALVCNANVQPSAEICDGIDDDCDGVIDNGDPGGGAACNTGKQGVCAAGTTSCTNGAIVCNQNVQPSAETCDGKDDDCDGAVDNGDPGGGASCNTGNLGVCAAGTTVCTGGAILCEQNLQPSAETCDGKDDDCDGVVDNGNPGGGIACTTGKQGVCSAGTTACTNGAIVCNQNVQAAAELCNGLDDDCNGATDEGNPGGGVACNTGKQGGCSAGTTACTNGAIACKQNVQPSAETCDGLDNDCNGAPDDGVTQACYAGPAGTNGVGACHGGTQTCTNGSFGACVGQVLPSIETCDDVDDNCDGQVDENVTQSCYTGPPGTNGVGACHGGTQTCANGSFGACVGQVLPSTETCNGLDDNCNGQADEGVKTTYYRDADGDGYGNPGVTTQACSQPSGYVTNNTDCDDTKAAVHPGGTEVCNGIDDNCNGTVDEGVKNTYYADADGDGFGNPSVTTQACARPAGYATNDTDCNDNNNAIRPGAPEVCNGIDDNCNGQADEGNPGGGVGCGACNQGATLCSGGALSCQSPNAGLATYYRDADGDGYGNPAVTTQACSQPAGYVTIATDCNDNNAAIRPSAPEVCNGVDDNCNGATDEGNPGGGISCNTGKLGVCAAGTTACTGGALVCNQNVQPSAEVCDNKDNDCNGLTDDSAINADGMPNTCASAANKVVAVPPGGTADVTGYIDPNGDDWFVVNFTGVPGAGGYYHPRIRFVSNPSTQFKLVVYSSCGTVAAGCTGSLDQFEMTYPNNPNGCYNTNGGFTCTDNIPRMTQLIVQVTRVAGAPYTCTPYTIRADDL